MSAKIFRYPVTIKESHLDFYGHMNNAMYLILFEEARWELITQNGYGVKKINETGLGPIILEIKLKFLKEIQLREEVIIETQIVSYEKKICILMQKMVRAGEICATAEIVFGLFSLQERRLVLPTPDWLNAIGSG